MHDYTELGLQRKFQDAEKISAQLQPLRAVMSKYLREKWNDNDRLIPIAYIKAWSELMGMAGGPVRPGLPQITAKERQELRADVERTGLLAHVWPRRRLKPDQTSKRFTGYTHMAMHAPAPGFAYGVVGRFGIAFVVAAAALPRPADAQQDNWPTKPVRVVIPFSAGSPIEVPARAVTMRMSESLGQSFVFDYRTGASGTIGTEAVARAPKDGYTMLITNYSHTANPSYYKKLPYDTLADFAPVSQINASYGNLLVVHPSIPAHSVKEFIALAKARPGEIKYASAGIGSPPHVAAALFAAMTGINLLHVPYKGTAGAFNDVLGGHVESMVASTTLAIPYVHAGRLRALGVSGLRRHPLAPDVPTFDEAGLTGFDTAGYHGMWFPVGTPSEIVRRAHGEVVKALALPVTRKYLEENGLIPVGSTPEEFAEYLRKDLARQAVIAKQIGIQPQ